MYKILLVNEHVVFVIGSNQLYNHSDMRISIEFQKERSNKINIARIEAT